jgi:dihydroorotase
MLKKTGFEIEIPRIDDLHVHLRQEEFMREMMPFIYQGGVGRVLVMPNLKPPVTTTQNALDYREELIKEEPRIDYLMTLYLHKGLSVAEIKKAKQNGINNIKLYPMGVTTNSSEGVSKIEKFYPIFEFMQAENMILNIHGETASNYSQNTCIMNAENKFLPFLDQIHTNFPKLRIVLEHITTASSREFIENSSEYLVATITAHHLDLVVDDWGGKNHNFCKPVAKYPSDRRALREAATSGNPKFFLGSDSAPHKKGTKETACGCAGVFTAPNLAEYYIDLFDRLGAVEKFENFATKFGADFYQLPKNQGKIVLKKQEKQIPDQIAGVVPFKAGKKIGWTVI